MKRNSKIYTIYKNIKQRCYNPNNPHYKDYGGRDITLYEGWLNEPDLFEAYILSLGECPPGYELDRVDNDYGYHPMNLRWFSKPDNLRNRRLDYNTESGKTGFKWVTRTREGLESYKGQFTHKSKYYHTKTYPTPQLAYEEVLRMRAEMGLI